MAWLNSDDMYVLNSLWVVGSIFSDLRQSVQWITGVTGSWDETGNLFKVCNLQMYARSLIRFGCYEGHAFGWIRQESTFWSRRLWDLAGGFLDASMQFAGDFDLWGRFSYYTDLYSADALIGGFRRHPLQKTASHLHRYCEEIESILSNGGGKRWLNKLVKNRLGRRIVWFWMSKEIAEKLVSYDIQSGRWVIAK